MVLGHLRANAVAYVALLLAFSLSGASYAGVHLAKGSVTAPKIAKNAVTSAKIKNGSVKASDLASTVLPQEGRTWIGHRNAITPVTTPDSGLVDPYQVQVPRGGVATVTYFVRAYGGTCSSNPARLGLYIDGVPIPDTAVPTWGTSADPETTMTGGTVGLTAGKHTFAMGVDCPNGNQGLQGWGASTWNVSMHAEGASS